MSDHIIALRSVDRDSELPRCADVFLQRARDAGLIEFVGWPSGHWKFTAKGRQEMVDHEAMKGGDT